MLGITKTALLLMLFQTQPPAKQRHPAKVANSEIVAMITAKLPELIILKKIQEGQGRWDTSPSALMKLKKLGASDQELVAISESASPQGASVNGQSTDHGKATTSAGTQEQVTCEKWKKSLAMDDSANLVNDIQYYNQACQNLTGKFTPAK